VGRRLKGLFWFAAVALVLRACVLEPVRMTDESMSPVLQEGDVALVSKLRYGLRVPGAGSLLAEWNAPRDGDFVVAVSVGDPPVSLLRRITGVPHEKVKLPDGKELLLKEGEYFLSAEGADSMDSRKLGPVPRKAIIGKATHIWLAKRPSAEAGSRVESPKPEWRILQPL
jgi:signal peptidase I